ncbi:conserved hypothetical protein [Paraburkholderia atlantica]|uniref:Uncharacterized protein n=1 Tax=Paraburkholderia atlantica TaxID=2654982 RepID=D5WMC3_PARAM|nr:hypothetical protein [Paraburkholderia atlantica]ADG20369.1 conserved hypothetical protein [Paraburkholderia atlantica]
MKNGFVELPVTLTDEEAEEIDAQARTQGVSLPDHLSYCTRAGAFGHLHARKMLPVLGQVGTSDEADSGRQMGGVP